MFDSLSLQDTKFPCTQWPTDVLPLIGTQVHDKHFFVVYTPMCGFLILVTGIEAHSTAADLRQRRLAHSALGPNEMEWHVE